MNSIYKTALVLTVLMLAVCIGYGGYVFFHNYLPLIKNMDEGREKSKALTVQKQAMTKPVSVTGMDVNNPNDETYIEEDAEVATLLNEGYAVSPSVADIKMQYVTINAKGDVSIGYGWDEMKDQAGKFYPHYYLDQSPTNPEFQQQEYSKKDPLNQEIKSNGLTWSLITFIGGKSWAAYTKKGSNYVYLHYDWGESTKEQLISIIDSVK